MNNLSECNQNVKKAFLNIISENIPPELKHIPQWVNWRGVWKPDKGKWDKVPFQPDGGYAKTNDPSTWYPFETVAGRNGQFDGIGFVLTKESGIIGFDFDHCIENSVISSEVQTVIDILNSYTEKSPSGSGIRIFCYGKLPAGIRKNTEKGYECYDSGRYLTLTGHHIEGTPLTLEERKREIRQVHSEYFKKPEKPPFPHPPPVITAPLSTQELLEKAFQSANGDKIQRLFSGNWSDYASQSEADLALCCCLAFWFDRNESDIDSVFRQSGLMREKWDKKHGKETYGQMTINKAIANCTEVYTKQRTEQAVAIPNDFEQTLISATLSNTAFPFKSENLRIINKIKTADSERWQLLRAKLKVIKGFSITELEKILKTEKKKVEIKKHPEKSSEFWYESFNNNGEIVLKINRDNLYNIFKSDGVCRIRLKKDDRNLFLVQIENNICKEIEISDLQRFVYEFIERLPLNISEHKDKHELKEVFARGINSYISDSLNNFFLDVKTPEFVSDTDNESYFFFKNGFVEITKDSLSLKNYSQLRGVIWQSQITDHEFKPETVSDFTFTHFIRCVCTDKRTGKLDIPRHTALQEVMGYLLHNHVTAYNNKAVIFSESSLDDDPQGRTGKGLIMQAVGQLRKKTTIDGKNFSFDSQFAFQNMELDTRVLFFDDVKKHFDFRRLYSTITEGISFEKKNRDRINLIPSQSPRIVISTNYAIQGGSESDRGRRIDMELLCYFSSSYRPKHKFREIFFESWDSVKWNLFYNFMLSCVQKWLKSKQITAYESGTKELKRIVNETSADFVEFAKELPTDTELRTTEQYTDFIQTYGISEKDCKTERFGKWLVKWCKYSGFELVSKRRRIDNKLVRFFMIKTHGGDLPCSTCVNFIPEAGLCDFHEGDYKKSYEKCKGGDYEEEGMKR